MGYVFSSKGKNLVSDIRKKLAKAVFFRPILYSRLRLMNINNQIIERKIMLYAKHAITHGQGEVKIE